MANDTKQKFLMAQLNMRLNLQSQEIKYTPIVPEQSETKEVKKQAPMSINEEIKEEVPKTFDKRPIKAKEIKIKENTPNTGFGGGVTFADVNKDDKNSPKEIKGETMVADNQYMPIELKQNEKVEEPFSKFVLENKQIGILQLPKKLPIEISENKRYKIGTMRVYKSGKTVMVIGDKEFEIHKGVDPNMHQELAIVKDNEIHSTSINKSKYIGYLNL
jgi:hypothetical protein